jgi:hypothetical protein
MIPREQTCSYCYHSAACTLFQGVCSWAACFSKPRDPYAQFEEGKIAIETVDRFLTQ